MIVDLGFWMRRRLMVLTFELLCFLLLGLSRAFHVVFRGSVWLVRVRYKRFGYRKHSLARHFLL